MMMISDSTYNDCGSVTIIGGEVNVISDGVYR